MNKTVNVSVRQLSGAARQAVRAKDWRQVGLCAKEILKRTRDSAEGRFLQGLADKGLNKADAAIKSFERALRLDGGRYDAAVELAELLMRASRHGEAAELLRGRVSKMQNSPLYLDKAATVFANIGLPEEAYPLARRAVELQPTAPSLQASLAACSVYVGEIDEARDIYRSLLDANPRHQRNHYELSRLARATDDSHVGEMQSVLDEMKLPPEKNIYLYYAIGKELEDLERWDEAFEYFRKGGDAAKSVGDYVVDSDIAIIDKIIDVCGPDWLRDERAVTNVADGSKTPVFVVGLPRTGTTLTERILTSHSMVESVGESFFMQTALKQVSRVVTAELMSPAIIDAVAGKDMARIAKAYVDAVSYRFGDRPLFVEKLPENVLYLGFIAKAFPDARIVLLRRNPMDSCFALYKQSFFRYAYNLDDLGAYYVAYDRLYRHWQAVLGERLVEVRYETLVANQEQETRRLLESLHLPFEPQCLEFERNAAASNTASTVQIREKIHKRSVLRWKHFEQQLRPLAEYLRAAGIDIDQ